MTRFIEIVEVAMQLSEVLIFKLRDGIEQEVVDRSDGLIGQFRQVQDEGVAMTHEGLAVRCALRAARSAALRAERSSASLSR